MFSLQENIYSFKKIQTISGASVDVDSTYI